MHKKIIRNIFCRLFIATIIFLISFIFIKNTINVNAEVGMRMEAKKLCNAVIDDNFTDDTILVTLNKNESSKNLNYSINDFPNLELLSVTDLTKNALQTNDEFRKTLVLKLANPSKKTVLNYIKILEQEETIFCAEPNYIGEFSSVSPNDPFLNNQWALSNIQAYEAWNYTTGTNVIRVGIVDSGIDAYHPDLVNRVNRELSVDCTGNDNPWADGNNHGTHVAGIIGAQGNNLIGVTGVNWNVELVSLKVGTTVPTAEAVADAIMRANFTSIKILNLSMNINETEAINSAIKLYNGIIVCAAGNSSDTIISYPARLDNPKIISVGSLDNGNVKSDFSSWGKVDIWAPGRDILSTIPSSYCLNHNVIFNDGTRLCELKSSTIQYLNNLVAINNYTWERIVDNFNSILGKAPSEFKESNHEDIGYHYMKGTSMAAPYVAGTAALLLSINPDLTTLQIREAIIQGAVQITITVDRNTTQNVVKLNAYNSIKYVLKNYINTTTYTLSNYSSTISTEKVVDSNASYFNELNEIYKLNVTYAKNYEFISSSKKGIEVNLYDENFNEILYNDIDTMSGRVHFIKNLNIGVYYLKTKFINEKDIGTINTKIISRNTSYLGIGENDILINTYNNINEYIYVNNQEEGFYKFSLNSNFNELYSEGILKIYSNQNRTELLNKYGNTEINDLAITHNNENELYVFLPENGLYYLDVNLQNYNYSSMNITIEKVEIENINYQDLLASITVDEIFTNKNSTSFFKEVTISHRSKIELDIMTNGTINRDIPVYIFEKHRDPGYEAGDDHYYLILKYTNCITSINRSPVFTVILNSGTYYIGYSDNFDNNSIQFALKRVVNRNLNIGGTLVADPANDLGFIAGSEVTLNGGSFRGNTITEGFTRHLYLMVENVLEEPMSRLEYDWYSSNENVAKVTAYGTVLALNVNADTDVTIYAVNKDDPSRVYLKTFTIKKEIETDPIFISCEMSYSYAQENGNYTLELDFSNSPYPMIQYYNWSIDVPNQENNILVSMNYFGVITSSGIGYVVLTGVYTINPRVTITITLTITE